MERVLPQAFRGRTNQLDWRRVSFMAGLHLTAVATLVRATTQPPAWPTAALAVTWLLCSGLSITGGYDRLFAHRSYRCSRTVAAFYLLFGAAAVQNSALTWASAHRRHHAHTDRDEDPYDARRGLWWSHIGWLLHARGHNDYANVPDLSRDRLVALQHRLYTPLAVGMAGVVPMLIAWAWRDPLGGSSGQAAFASSCSTTERLPSTRWPTASAAGRTRRRPPRATTRFLPR